MTDKKIVIGALSGWQMGHRRDRVRRTFLPDVKRYGMEYMFLLGAGAEIEKPTLEHDMLVLPVKNHYDSLPTRTRAWCKWLLENRDFDLVYKCDDDTFISVSRFHRFAQKVTGSYTGTEFHPQAFWHSGGAGFFMDRKAVQIIAEQMKETTGAEDLLCGVHLNKNGISTEYLAETRRQDFVSKQPRIPAKGNDLIVAHAAHTENWLTDEVWQKAFEEAK